METSSIPREATYKPTLDIHRLWTGRDLSKDWSNKSLSRQARGTEDLFQPGYPRDTFIFVMTCIWLQQLLYDGNLSTGREITYSEYMQESLDEHHISFQNFLYTFFFFYFKTKNIYRCVLRCFIKFAKFHYAYGNINVNGI